jgi:hypothetical protein
MSPNQSIGFQSNQPSQFERMRWYIFWIFIILFVIASVLTILGLFFGIGNLSERHEDKLVLAFVIEVGVAVAALFYSLFGLKKTGEAGAAQQIPDQASEAHLEENVSLITSNDAPIDKGVTINLDKPVSLDLTDSLGSYIAGSASVKDFHKLFVPSMMQYVAKVEFGELRPNIVLQFDLNPLPHLNMTLADYVKSNVEVLRGILSLKGERQIRASFDAAVQWFSYDIALPTENDPEHTIAVQAFQKYVVSDDRIGILTITYPTEGSDPEHLRCLHEFLSEFGVAKQ